MANEIPALTAKALALFDPDSKSGFKRDKGAGTEPAFFDQLIAKARSGDREALNLMANLAGGVCPDGSTRPEWADKAARTLLQIHNDSKTHGSLRIDIEACAFKLVEILAAHREEGITSSVQVPAGLLRLALTYGDDRGYAGETIHFLNAQFASEEPPGNKPLITDSAPLPDSRYEDDDPHEDLDDPHRFTLFEEIFDAKPKQHCMSIAEYPLQLVLEKNAEAHSLDAESINRIKSATVPTAFVLHKPGHWMTLFLVPTQGGKVDAVFFDSYGVSREARETLVKDALSKALRGLTGESALGAFFTAGGDMQGNAENACGAFCVKALEVTAGLGEKPSARMIQTALNQFTGEFERADAPLQAALMASVREAMAPRAHEVNRLLAQGN